MIFRVATAEGVVGTYETKETDKEKAYREVESEFPDAAFIGTLDINNDIRNNKK